MPFSREKKGSWIEPSGTTYMGHPTDIHIQRGGRTAKEANIPCDVGLDYIGCATSDFQYLLFGRRAAGRHLVGLVVEAVVTKQMSRR